MTKVKPVVKPPTITAAPSADADLSAKDIVRVMRTLGRPDPLAAGKRDPAFSYRWVRKTKVDLRVSQGWEIVHVEAVGGRGTTVEFNELILCRMPKAKADLRTKLKQTLVQENLRSVKGKLEDAAGEFGKETGEPAPKVTGDVKLQNIRL